MISRLPPEVLARIFSLHHGTALQEHVSSTESVASKRRRHPTIFSQPECFVPWIVPSQVSSTWRYVALDTAYLWNVLLLNSVPWTKEFVTRRSKRAPLTVQIASRALSPTTSIAPQDLIECLGIAIDQAGDRIQSLDLSNISLLATFNPDLQSHDRLHRLLRVSKLPKLLSLVISHTIGQLGSTACTIAAATLLREVVEAGESASHVVTSLTVRHFPHVQWSGVSISSLKRLVIEGCRDLRAGTLLSVLVRLPNLEQVHVLRSFDCPEALPEAQNRLGGDATTIYLPSIRNFTFLGLLWFWLPWPVPSPFHSIPSCASTGLQVSMQLNTRVPLHLTRIWSLFLSLSWTIFVPLSVVRLRTLLESTPHHTIVQ